MHTLAGHTGEVTSVAFSPDGARVVSGSNDLLAIVWDAETGAEVLILSHALYQLNCLMGSTPPQKCQHISESGIVNSELSILGES